MKLTNKIGPLLLAVWLILLGLISLLQLSFAGMHIVQGGLAVAAGMFILVDR